MINKNIVLNKEQLGYRAMVNFMCEGNKEAREIIDYMSSSQDYYKFLRQLQILQEKNIKGNNIVKLFNESSNADYQTFYLTIDVLDFRSAYTKKDIEKNLSLDKSLPFIDKSIDNPWLYWEATQRQYDREFVLYAKRNAKSMLPKIEVAYAKQIGKAQEKQ